MNSEPQAAFSKQLIDLGVYVVSFRAPWVPSGPHVTTHMSVARSTGELDLAMAFDLIDLSYEERVVSADVIRRLCVRPHAKRVDCRGIRVRGARVERQCRTPHPRGPARQRRRATGALADATHPRVAVARTSATPSRSERFERIGGAGDRVALLDGDRAVLSSRARRCRFRSSERA
jgi:hypothetical protein